jgi:hypothetical protein
LAWRHLARILPLTSFASSLHSPIIYPEKQKAKRRTKVSRIPQTDHRARGGISPRQQYPRRYGPDQRHGVFQMGSSSEQYPSDAGPWPNMRACNITRLPVWAHGHTHCPGSLQSPRPLRRSRRRQKPTHCRQGIALMRPDVRLGAGSYARAIPSLSWPPGGRFQAQRLIAAVMLLCSFLTQSSNKALTRVLQRTHQDVPL